jgi:putative tricarboxylic transport membrane protein
VKVELSTTARYREEVIMKKREIFSSLGWVLFGLMISYGAVSLGLGSFRRPGPGLFHFIIGIAILLLSSCQIIAQLRKTSVSRDSLPQSDGLKKIIYAMMSLIFYAITLEYLGFLVCTVIFFMLLLRIVGQRRWGYTIVTSVTVSALTYIVFRIWLNVNLPMGFWGI